VDAKDALDHVRTRLEGSFGKALAMLIMASSCNAAGVSMVGIDVDQYKRLVDAVAKDSRVIDMWGSAGAADAATQWRGLV
jgi:hypothetical protein